MKNKTSYLLKIGCTSILCIFAVVLFGQEPQTTIEPQPSREQLAVEKSENTLAILEKKISSCDSIIQSSKKELEVAMDSLDANGEQRKELDKVYAQKRKTLLKQTESKDKTISATAKTDLKALDAAYRTSTKENDTRYKAFLKQSDNASRQIEKTETTKKATQVKLKETKKTLNTAQKNLAAKEKSTSSSKGKERK
jgi:hypothetical protein